MRISEKQIKELQKLLFELTGSILSPEDAQATGLAVIRFVSAKELQKDQLTNKENISYEREPRKETTTSSMDS